MSSSIGPRLRGLVTAEVAAGGNNNNSSNNLAALHLPNIVSANTVRESLGDKENVDSRLTATRRGAGEVNRNTPCTNNNHQTGRTPIGTCGTANNSTPNTTDSVSGGNSPHARVDDDEDVGLEIVNASPRAAAGTPLVTLAVSTSPLTLRQPRLFSPDPRSHPKKNAFKTAAHRAGNGCGRRGNFVENSSVPTSVSSDNSSCVRSTRATSQQGVLCSPLLSPCSSSPGTANSAGNDPKNVPISPPTNDLRRVRGDAQNARSECRTASEGYLAPSQQNPPSPLSLTPSRLYESTAASRGQVYTLSSACVGAGRVSFHPRLSARRRLGLKCASAGKIGVLEGRSVDAALRRGGNFNTNRRPASVGSSRDCCHGTRNRELQRGIAFFPEVEACTHSARTAACHRKQHRMERSSIPSPRTTSPRPNISFTAAATVPTSLTVVGNEQDLELGANIVGQSDSSVHSARESLPELELPAPMKCDEAVSLEVEAEARSRQGESNAAARRRRRRRRRRKTETVSDGILDSSLEDEHRSSFDSCTSLSLSMSTEAFSLSRWGPGIDGSEETEGHCLRSVRRPDLRDVGTSCSSVDTCGSIASFDGWHREPTCREEAMAGKDPVARMLLDQSDDESLSVFLNRYIEDTGDNDSPQQQSKQLCQPLTSTNVPCTTTSVVHCTPDSTAASFYGSFSIPLRTSDQAPSDAFCAGTDPRDRAFSLGSCSSAFSAGKAGNTPNSSPAFHALAVGLGNPTQSSSSHVRAKSEAEIGAGGRGFEAGGGQGKGDPVKKFTVTRHERAVSTDAGQSRSRRFRPIVLTS